MKVKFELEIDTEDTTSPDETEAFIKAGKLRFLLADAFGEFVGNRVGGDITERNAEHYVRDRYDFDEDSERFREKVEEVVTRCDIGSVLRKAVFDFDMFVVGE